jgi:hypothetical protein
MNPNKPDTLLEVQKVNVDELEREVDKLTLKQWGEWGWRQLVNRFPHGDTNTYPFIWSQEPVNNIIHISKSNQRTKIWRLVKRVTNCLLKKYNGKIVKCMIVRLPAHTKIGKHIDDQFSLVNSHRFHLPIKTNSDIIFDVDSVPYYFKREQWYEINNQLPHAVENNSDYDRVHLIVDILPFSIARSENLKFKNVRSPTLIVTELGTANGMR